MAASVHKRDIEGFFPEGPSARMLSDNFRRPDLPGPCGGEDDPQARRQKMPETGGGQYQDIAVTATF